MNSVLVLSGSRAVYQSLRSILGTRASVEHGERLADVHNLLARKPVDVVIVDTELRDCDGAEALRTLAREGADPTLIALTLSAKLNGFPTDPSLGLFAYLTKPFEAEQVRFVVERAIERAELHRRIKYLSKQVRPREQLAVPAGPEPPDLRREYRLFQRCARAFAREVRVATLANGLAEILAEEFVVPSVGVLLWDAGSRRFAPAAAYGLDEQAVAEAAFLRGQGIAGWLDEHGIVLRADDVARLFDDREGMAVAREFELLRAELAVPLLRRGKLLGFIAIGRKVSGRAITEAEVEWLVLIADMAAVAVENVQAREALAFEKRCAEGIVAGLDVGVIAADAKGTITASNRAAEKSLGLDEPPAGENLRVLGTALSQIAGKSLRSGERLAECGVRHETTGRRFVVSAAPIPGDGGPTGVVLVLREHVAGPGAPAGEAERMEFWAELAGRMAHTLKNPLVSIKTFTQLLPERYADDEFRKNFLDVVDAEADTIKAIADRLALYASVHELEPVPTDLCALIEKSLETHAARFRDRGIEVRRRLEELPIVVGDPDRLAVALDAVVENSLDAMEDGGRLVVETALVEAADVRRADEGFVLDFTEAGALGPASGEAAPFAAIEISDTGGGISRDILGKVFQPFFSKKIRGVGLGLAIVARVIRGHRGRVEIASTPGKGTRVRLLLPSAC